MILKAVLLSPGFGGPTGAVLTVALMIPLGLIGVMGSLIYFVAALVRPKKYGTTLFLLGFLILIFLLCFGFLVIGIFSIPLALKNLGL